MLRTFTDSPDLGVITTRQLLHEGAPLGLISHDLDGDWQFLHAEAREGEEPDERSPDDMVLVHVGLIVSRFPEVLAFADLPPGWIAWPDEEGAAWLREPRPAEWDDE